MTANLSFKMPNISEKDKIIVIKKILFILQFFLCTSHIILTFHNFCWYYILYVFYDLKLFIDKLA